MNVLPFSFRLLVFALTVATASAQTDSEDTTNAETPAAGSTVITSDELHMDQQTHTAIFTGNVVVNGDQFKMTCQEMTVYSTTANKIEHIVADGNVVIIQPGRITHCGHAIYYRDEDKFVLTDQPDILDNQNEIQAPTITIFRTKKELITQGRTRTKIIQGPGGSTNSVATPIVATPTPGN
jgi:lipopolysaccharide export system protein LptA